MFRNPAPSIAILTAFLFALVRIAIESFYGSLGVQPEDVGLDSVQETLQGSALILVLVIAITVAYGVGMVVVGSALLGAYAVVRSLLFGGRSDGHIWRGVRRGLRLGPALIPLVCIPFATIVLVNVSFEDLDGIRSGKAVDNPLAPWRAERVLVNWTTPDPPYGSLKCHTLLYLGEGDYRTVIFDARHQTVLEINSKDVDLTFLPAGHNPRAPC